MNIRGRGDNFSAIISDYLEGKCFYFGQRKYLSSYFFIIMIESLGAW